MVFSSAIFLWLFLPITLLVYYLAPGRLKNLFLLLASLTFYSWGEPKYIFLMMISIVINYFLGLIIDKFNNQLKCCIFVVAILFNIGILMFFKYGAFLIENVNLVFGIELSVPQIALPIGISFYTFQALSYIIDLYRGKIKVQKSILNLALYITLFPQLIAGPIVRYTDIEKEIENRAISIFGIKEGIYRFIIGLSKKVLIADRVAVISDEAFALVSPPCALAWIGIIAYAIQIYYDFSGYSDMAIGLGKMLGFNFNENFNYPYFSKSIKEFWRRWHISLSTWFRDYVYIPLGGSRCSSIRASFNLIIVFFLTGFWHGASWNFIIWGLYYAFFLILERYCGKGGGVSAWFQHLYVTLVVLVGWVFFRSDNLLNSLYYLKSMFFFSGKNFLYSISYLDRERIFFLILGIIFCFPIHKWWEQHAGKQMLVLKYVITTLGFVVSLLYIIGSDFSPFLYFRF